MIDDTASLSLANLTLLVRGVTGSADTARETAQELGVAANALHVEVAAGAE